jgi:hypothetical protein
MKNLNDLKTIWLCADTTGLPDADEVIKVIKKYRYTKLVKSVSLVLYFLASVTLFAWVVFYYRPTLLSTRMGEGCIIADFLILIITNITTVDRYYKYKDLSNKEFISFLEHTRVRQKFHRTKTQVVVFILLTIGEYLCLFELVYKNIVLGIIVYSCATVFFLIIWFIIRPWAIKKQSVKLDKTIQKMKDISKQL